AGRNQMGQGVLHAQVDAAQVDRDYAVEDVVVEFAQLGVFLDDGGVVVDDIEPAELLDRARKHLLHVGRLRHVGADSDRPSALVLNTFCGFRGGRLVDIDRSHSGAFGGKQQ